MRTSLHRLNQRLCTWIITTSEPCHGWHLHILSYMSQFHSDCIWRITVCDVICKRLKTSKELQMLASSHLSHFNVVMVSVWHWFCLMEGWHAISRRLQSSFHSNGSRLQMSVFERLVQKWNHEDSYDVTLVPKRHNGQTFDLTSKKVLEIHFPFTRLYHFPLKKTTKKSIVASGPAPASSYLKLNPKTDGNADETKNHAEWDHCMGLQRMLWLPLDRRYGSHQCSCGWRGMGPRII